MSTPESGSTRTATRPNDPGGSTQERAKQAAGTAADETQHVAGVARGEAQRVADEARSHARSLLDEATSQLEDQSRTQKDRLADTVGSLARDLDSMASQADSGLAADLAREAADRARGVSDLLQAREPRELLDDVRSFARRRPGAFLGGALVAGLVAGRLARGARDAHGSTSGQVPSPGSGSRPAAVEHLPTSEQELGTAAGTPLAGTGTPPPAVTPEATPEAAWVDESSGGRP